MLDQNKQTKNKKIFHVKLKSQIQNSKVRDMKKFLEIVTLADHLITLCFEIESLIKNIVQNDFDRKNNKSKYHSYKCLSNCKKSENSYSIYFVINS